MRWRGRWSLEEVKQLRRAARTLFGPHKAAEDAFWQNLTLETLKQAFREQAKRYHPDLNGELRPAIRKAAQERFLMVKDSYDLLKRFLGADLFRPFEG